MFYFISDNNATKLTVIMIAIEPMRPMIAGLEFNENFLSFSFWIFADIVFPREVHILKKYPICTQIKYRPQSLPTINIMLKNFYLAGGGRLAW